MVPVCSSTAGEIDGCFSSASLVACWVLVVFGTETRIKCRTCHHTIVHIGMFLFQFDLDWAILVLLDSLDREGVDECPLYSERTRWLRAHASRKIVNLQNYYST